jgi:hypothetical protein
MYLAVTLDDKQQTIIVETANMTAGHSQVNHANALLHYRANVDTVMHVTTTGYLNDKCLSDM